MNSHCRWLGALIFLTLWPVSALAQDAAPPAALLAQRLSEEVRSRVLNGRALLDNNDDLAVATLRDAAQSALPALEQIVGKNVLGAAPESLPRDVVT
ncbi:MAG: hypothetical protein KY445_07655, partial [Armatimonadetes bacterium]|nr:hypothetical protein [Armatimonadota bacterium]